ncbi:hypothetical protein NPIL_125671 [Nephila pilipes]|uniref:Uncharacterized protein n=1 Tax=Nephila pilipes TaxID=299642 RepID=A0A8X6PSM6_NEPPI|nr:hypothetical protein NPIL_125671 [Nephila pilipes]
MTLGGNGLMYSLVFSCALTNALLIVDGLSGLLGASPLSPSGAPEKRSLSSDFEAVWFSFSCSRFCLQKILDFGFAVLFIVPSRRGTFLVPTRTYTIRFYLCGLF